MPENSSFNILNVILMLSSTGRDFFSDVKDDFADYDVQLYCSLQIDSS